MANDVSKEIHNELIIHYLTLRKAIGFLGILLPIVLGASSLIGGNEFEISISHYYHTGMRDFFTGTMCAVGLFLICYNGYKKAKDGLASRIAALLAFGVAFFPTTQKVPPCTPEFTEDTTGILHLVCAASFFLVLAIISLVYFTKTDEHKSPTPQKKIRNRIYRFCGISMLICLVLMAVFLLPSVKCEYQSLKPVFILEAAGLFFFGTSWLVKGETLFRDKKSSEN